MNMTNTLRTAAFAAATALVALPAAADLVRITDRGSFLNTVQGRELSRIGINLRVSTNGAISGRALGLAVRGDWSWQNGYFCRTLEAGDRDFGYNCQAVSANGNTIRFQSDQGTGDYADFRLR